VLKTTDKESGIYCLLIKCSRSAKIDNPRFSNVNFPMGFYYYIGSAQKNLTKRIERHFRREKKIHWHIDYLTTNESFECLEAYLINNKKKSFECALSKDFSKIFNMRIAVPYFGNSDCTECDSHLYYSPVKLPYSHFISRYQSIVRLIPSSKNTF
jgi:Uri superfamily endonuclease